jgi:hypothetical protein
MNEVERLSENFETELAKIYVDHKPARREYILLAIAKLRAKYGQKLMSLRSAGRMTDDAERAIVRIENEHAAKLAAEVAPDRFAS